MIDQGGTGRDVDLAEVARDAELLDVLAARAQTPDGDTVSALLAAFAAEVDDGLAALLQDLEPGHIPGPAPGALSGPSGFRADLRPAPVPESASRLRGHGMRATTIALVLGATLSVSGVAAAVTGDPLSPYKGIVSAVRGGNDLPSNAARVASMNHSLVGIRAQIAHGDLAGAQATLAGLRADLASMTDLTKGERAAVEARIAALEAALGRATSRAAAHETQQKSGTNGTHPAEPNNTRTSEPNNTKITEPHNTKTPHPESTNTPGPNSIKTPEPNNTKIPESQATGAPAPTQALVSGNGHSADSNPND